MLYLARWRLDPDSGPGDLTPDLGPDTEGLSFAAFDLRGQADRLAGRVADDEVRGWCVAWTPDKIETKRNRIIRLGDDPDDVSVAALRTLESRLGWNPGRGKRPNRLGDLVFEFAADEFDDVDNAKPNRLAVTKQGRREVRIGPHLMGGEPVPSSVGAAFTDDFNRADGGIGADWTKVSNDSNPVFTITSNQLAVQGSTGVAYYTYDAGQAATDAQYCEIEVADLGYNQFAPQVRMLNSLANGSGYQAYWQGHTDNIARIRYTNTAAAPSRTTLTSDTSATGVADLPVIRIEVDGSALSWWHDGTELTGIATTDTTYPGASTRRSGGLYLFAVGIHVDNWAFGDLGIASQDITTTPIASTAVVTTPAVAPGPVTVTATPIAAGSAVGTPTLAPGPVTITTTPIASTAAVSMPGVETAAGLVATPVGSSASVTTPTVAGGPVGFTADALASTAAVTGPSVAAGPVAVSATPIGGTASLTGPTVALGPANLTVTPIGSGVSVTTPDVAARVAITPTPLGSMVAFLALSIATGAAVGSADVTLGVYLDKSYGRVKTGPSPLSSHILNTTRRSAPLSER